MKFEINRTSEYGKKPCEEAVKSTIVNVDIRTVDNPEKLKCMSVEDWYNDGTNHRVINGEIARDFENKDCYTVEINTIEQLIELNNKYGELIIRKSYIDDETPAIEIYDDYRE